MQNNKSHRVSICWSATKCIQLIGWYHFVLLSVSRQINSMCRKVCGVYYNLKNRNQLLFLKNERGTKWTTRAPNNYFTKYDVQFDEICVALRLNTDKYIQGELEILNCKLWRCVNNDVIIIYYRYKPQALSSCT